MRSSALLSAVFALLFTSSAVANPKAGELSLSSSTAVPLGVALSNCLATETPLVKEFTGEVDFPENIRFTYVRSRDQLSAWIIGRELSAESAKKKLKVAERLVGIALDECAATHGVDSKQIFKQVRFVYANWRQSQNASAVLMSFDGKYELP